MGELIMMPSRNAEAAEAPVERIDDFTPAEVVSIRREERSAPTVEGYAIWKTAPRERTTAYFPVYSGVSKAIQGALRGWVLEWFQAHPEILLRPHTAYSILVYQCTHPFAGKATNIFTYDIQQTEALDRAFRSAAHRLGGLLKTVDTKRFSWFTREHYFAYRSREVVKYVSRNRRALYKMLNVETVLMNTILKFAIMDINRLGLAEAALVLRREFQKNLRRFSDEFDMSGHTDELLRIATNALKTKLAAEMELPVAA
ncbi:MAG TPA: hypothetical protein VHZ07_08015 [Bryobacteraceae bacterium]|jgi:hypothetical protein|nr:hypothetical protein [Bryobacteraceae bacterium]